MNIAKCPFCGNSDCVVDSTNLYHHITCLKCEAHGPLEDTTENASEAWNHLIKNDHVIKLLEEAEGRVMLVHVTVGDNEKEDLNHVINLLNDVMAELKGGTE
jgi:Lar family restriction alleviation protein